MKKINGTNIRKVLVPLVSYEDQTKIAREIRVMTRSLQDTEHRIAQEAEIKNRLLAAVFHDGMPQS